MTTDGGAGRSRSTAVAPPDGIVVVDKPGGMTSHDVVARVRRLAGTRRVGHAGTLDPMATGVLVVGVEKATRLLGYLSLSRKEYAATIRLGQSTTTDDAEGEPAGGTPAAGLPRAALDAGVAALTGEISQVPPRVSAIKVGGTRAYKLTRAGAAPELPPRPVTVYAFAITGVRPAGDCLDVDATIRCSSGTYIRALARDLGGALGTGGHLTALRRTSVGAYTIAQARTLAQLSERFVVTPLAEAAAATFPRVDLTADDARRLANGARIPVPAPIAPAGTPSATPCAAVPPATASSVATPKTPLAAFAPDGALVALVTEEAGRLRSLAVFAAPIPGLPAT
ncbi:tRNA pseudouridine(55) synthase TruB [Trebonia sp.]|uniref:tRNA pseudouridine(55) synthase TruB n=1 Tax=Trebonia sp. TaxID=2767075 RepID=UPI0026240473|nr:tRNA pseudouridine(55) synthase TruB [Trebonia sp.]